MQRLRHSLQHQKATRDPHSRISYIPSIRAHRMIQRIVRVSRATPRHSKLAANQYSMDSEDLIRFKRFKLRSLLLELPSIPNRSPSGYRLQRTSSNKRNQNTGNRVSSKSPLKSSNSPSNHSTLLAQTSNRSRVDQTYLISSNDKLNRKDKYHQRIRLHHSKN